MKLRHNPYRVFRSSKTPAGLYARQKWLGESGSPLWQADFQETCTALLADQSPDGSWQHDPYATITRLFGLHLTIRASSLQIEAALNWLLGMLDMQSFEIKDHSVSAATGADLKGLPFTPSRPALLLTGAALFLATIFGRDDDSNVLLIYRHLRAAGLKNRGHWHDTASSHNIFRALVVHPTFAKDGVTASAVARLADLQTDAGGWRENLPFYQTLNALAHLKSPQANRQLERAFERLLRSQNSDGTWSRIDPEWNTFLAVHALRNKGLLE